MTPPKRDAAACALLILVTVGVFWPWLLTGRALYWGDLGVYFQPLLHFERGQLLRGTLPLWNPQVFCGTPFFGNPQMWPLYPSTLLLPLTTASRFLTVSCAAHIALGGVFFYAFLRRGHLALGVWPSLVGATAFMLGGYFVTKAQYPNMLQALAWTPLILLQAERLAASTNLRAAALGLGIALGLQLLAAHAQVTLYTLYFALILGVFRLWGQGKSTWLRAAEWGIVSCLIALGLSCGEWLPVVDARRLAARQTLTLAHVNRLHLPWGELTDFALPFRYGNPLRGNWSGAGPAWETACYAGTVTLALAVFALICGLRAPQARRETVFWLCAFIASLWLALGAGGGLFRVAYAIIPGMTLFHDPARLLLGAAIALPVLGALGLRSLLALPRVTSRMAHGLGGLCLLLLALDMAPYDRGLYPLQPVATLENPASQSAALRAILADPVLTSGAGRVLSMDDINASVQFQPWTDYEAHLPGCVPRLAQTLLPNLPLLIGLSDAGGYEPLALARSTQLGSLAVGALKTPGGEAGDASGQEAQIASLLGWMSVRLVSAYRPQPPPSVPGLRPALAWADPGGVNHGFMRVNTLWQPRARVYSAWQAVPDNAPFAPAGWMGTLPVVDSPSRVFSLPTGAPAPPVPAVFARDSPDFVAMTLPATRARTPRLLMLADTHFPGWDAQIDGTPAPVLRANGIFRAVVVPPDAQYVTFSYRPNAVRLGLYVSLLTVSLLLASGLASRRKELR